MAIVCPKHRLLFIMVPRTGCTAIGALLIDQFEGRWLPRETVFSDGKAVVKKKHCTLGELVDHGILTKFRSRQLVKFAAIRNPFDNLVSFYSKLRNEHVKLIDNPDSWLNTSTSDGFKEDMRAASRYDFPDWIRARHGYDPSGSLDSLKKRSLYDHYVKGIDYLLQFEALDSHFQQVMTAAGVEQPAKIERVNTTKSREGGYRSYYDAVSRRIVETVFQDDLRRFGYSFEGTEPWPLPRSKAETEASITP